MIAAGLILALAGGATLLAFALDPATRHRGFIGTVGAALTVLAFVPIASGGAL